MLRPARACILGAILITGSACSSTAGLLPAIESSTTCYESRDSSMYNHVYLRLEGDGTYTIAMRGDIADWGAASGTWSASERTVSLNPTMETGQMKGFLRSATRKANGSLAFVPGGGTRMTWRDLAPYACKGK